MKRGEYELLLSEQDLEIRRLRRENRRLRRMMDDFLDCRDRITHMSLVTGREPDRDRVGHGYLPSDSEL